LWFIINVEQPSSTSEKKKEPSDQPSKPKGKDEQKDEKKQKIEKKDQPSKPKGKDEQKDEKKQKIEKKEKEQKDQSKEEFTFDPVGLATMKAMGFTDENQNLAMIVKHKGNVQAACMEILSLAQK